jgi:hypothetical protein
MMANYMDLNHEDRVVSYLPLSHIAAQVCLCVHAFVCVRVAELHVIHVWSLSSSVAWEWSMVRESWAWWECFLYGREVVVQQDLSRTLPPTCYTAHSLCHIQRTNTAFGCCNHQYILPIYTSLSLLTSPFSLSPPTCPRPAAHRHPRSYEPGSHHLFLSGMIIASLRYTHFVSRNPLDTYLWNILLLAMLNQSGFFHFFIRAFFLFQPDALKGSLTHTMKDVKPTFFFGKRALVFLQWFIKRLCFLFFHVWAIVIFRLTCFVWCVHIHVQLDLILFLQFSIIEISLLWLTTYSLLTYSHTGVPRVWEKIQVPCSIRIASCARSPCHTHPRS